MSHEPKPSEHAMLTAASISSYLLVGMHHSTKEGRAEIAHQIQEHAIAPAVAERDRRIAELEAALEETLKQLKHTQLMATRGYGPAMLTPDVIAFSEQILAKSERSAP